MATMAEEGGATAHAAAATMMALVRDSECPPSKTTKQRSRNALKPSDDPVKLLFANASMDAAIRLMQKEREKAVNGRLLRGFRQRLVVSLQESFPWITEDVLHNREEYQKRKEREQDAASAKDKDDNQQKPAAKRRAGQPKQVAVDSETNARTGVSEPPPAKRRKVGRPPKATSRSVMTARSTNVAASESQSTSNAPDHSSNPDSPSQPKNRKKGGRPKGTTLAAKKELSKREKSAIDRATILYAEAKKECDAKGENVLPRGTIPRVIEQAKKEFQVPDLHIPHDRIRARLRKGRKLIPEGRGGPTSPMAPLEPILVEFCKRVNKRKLPLDSKEFLKLANALVKGSETEQAVLDYVVARTSGADCVNLSAKYWKGFRKRHGDEMGKFHVLMGGAKHYYDKENLALSYETVYNDMVREGIGRKLNSPVWIVQKAAYTNDEAAGKGSADGGGAWL